MLRYFEVVVMDLAPYFDKKGTQKRCLASGFPCFRIYLIPFCLLVVFSVFPQVLLTQITLHLAFEGVNLVEDQGNS